MPVEASVPELQALSAAEVDRQETSFRKRVRARASNRAALSVAPPTAAELRGSQVFLDAPWSEDLQRAITARCSRVTASAHAATVFIATNPWKPNCRLTTLAAILLGAWVIPPETYINASGVALKYDSALATRRRVWVSAAARAAFPNTWLLLLELLAAHAGHKWSLLSSPEEFAAEKVRSKGRAEVLALVTPTEAAAGILHVMPPKKFFNFIMKRNSERTSL